MTREPEKRQRKPRSGRIGRSLLIICLAGVAAFSAAESTLAYLSKRDTLNNQFGIGSVGVDVTETFDAAAKVKSDVAVKNEGNVPVYIRAEVIIYWQDAKGNVMPEAPLTGTDYTEVWYDSSSCWKQGSDGYYYYTVPVAAGDSTEILLKQCRQMETSYDNGRTLVVDIASQAIQAEPERAVSEAWGIKAADDGRLEP